MNKPLTHEELPENFIVFAFMLFGDPYKVVWHHLNKSFYPNRKPYVRFFGGLRMEYVRHNHKYVVLRVMPV